MKRKILSGLLALCLVFSLLPWKAKADTNIGTCGPNLDWSLEDGTGKLIISGSGDMDDSGSTGSQPWYNHLSEIETVEIQEGVTSIGAEAFLNCTNLVDVSLPSSLTSIGYGAFNGCSSLTSIILPDSITSIGGQAFANCSGLTSIAIPDGVTTIGTSAFAYCTNLTSITLPDSVTSIEDWTFANCKSLTSISIPDGVESIKYGAFENCESLTSATLPDSLTFIGAYAFVGCTSLSSINLPANVTMIDGYAFSGCSSLTSITLPSGLTSIEGKAFSGCTSLTSITIPDGVTSIRDEVFSGCENLTSITIPNSVTSIGDQAFHGCALESLTIPNSVTSIGVAAFGGCGGLTSVIIGDSVTSIGDSAFGMCDNLKGVYFWNSDMRDSISAADIGLIGNTLWYPGNAELTFFSRTEASEDGSEPLVLTIESDRPFNAVNARAAATIDYVTVDTEDTGLTLIGALLDGSDTANHTLQVLLMGTSSGGHVSITIASEGFAGPANFTSTTTMAGGIDVPPGNFGEVPVPAPDPTPDPTPEPEPSPDPDTPPSPEPSPSRPSSSDREEREQNTAPVIPSKPTVVRVDDNIHTSEREKIVISGQGESDMQSIVKKQEAVRWIDRVELPQYALNLYDVLCIGGDYDTLYDLLIKDEYFTLSGGGSGKETANVDSVLEVVGQLDRPYASGSGVFQESSFLGGFDVIDTTAGDRAISYGSLKEGDVVRTSTYNGIYVTKVAKDGNSNYDTDLKTACSYASTSFQAFDRDHPEVFWLSGSSKLRMVTVTMQDGSRTYKETYIFFVLADADGFTVRDSGYSSQAEIESGIQRRDRAVAAILETVTGTTADEKAAQLNRWLTEHNHYNTSEDLYSLPNAPHECLSALEGNIGTSGPVCDGYARAFKVLCDKLAIPCVLVDGYALTKAGGPGEFHMWNSVQMPDEQWYGVDVTWNDPTVKGVEDAKSGREREDFLLVGAETVVFGLKFSESHPPKNRAADGGVSFINGPTLSAAAFNPLAGVSALPFADVDENSVFYPSIAFVYDSGLMVGTSETAFSPDRPLTRAMVWTILVRLTGEDTAGGTPWYSGAQSWSVNSGISDGSAPDAIVTRQQLAAMLWRYAGSPASEGSLEGFTDSGMVSGYAEEALRWAAESGIVTGKSDGSLQPGGSATRAQAAAMIERFCKISATEAP